MIRRLLGNLPEKLLALLAAGLVWYQLQASEPIAERTLTRPLQVLGVQQGQSVSGLPQTVELRLRGPARLIEGNNLSTVNAYIDLSGVGEGAFVRNVQVGLPAGVRLVAVEPGRVEGRLEAVVSQRLAVEIHSPGRWVRFEPTYVQAIGPRGLVNQAVKAVGVDMGGDQVRLFPVDATGEPLESLALNPGQARVIQRETIQAQKTVPLVLAEPPASLRVLEARIPGSVTLVGPVAALEGVTQVRASPEWRTGSYTSPLQLQLPEGVRVTAPVQGNFRVAAK
ncbi:MAG: YbbR-like domain-containing protein [Deinococcota bacterium]|uniref:YbbR family protein n=1 Tax=Allomeiothermus silvanus (strain ATCC 700542 / DSM 9946 / NBRC 106475 / NCIMB 13440 / VI-R2) TaxID=526227 RepID=D7BGV3_ALLS1|nr:CdaR family protein [Allomeiothermus silvanus]ADH62107.1 YbbR family protein [Allomeiothermus silvanus DSM 9946]MBI5812639.1 hypothetical protein [Allomeiothermus silvanus]